MSNSNSGGDLASKLLSGLTLPIALVVITTLLGALILRLLTPMNVVFLPAENLIYNNVLAGAAPSSEVQISEALSNGFPRICTVVPDPDSMYADPNEVGPRSSRCKDEIDANSKTPDLSYRLLIALDETATTGTDVRDQAAVHARVNSDDIDGWTHLPGGSQIQPLTRQRLSQYNALGADALTIDQRRNIAVNIIDLKAQERRVVSDFGEDVRSSAISNFVHFLTGKRGALQCAGMAILGIIGITVIRRHSGWRRALAVFFALCVVMAYLGNGTLEALSLEQGKSIYGNAEGLESIAGLPFVIGSQLIDFLARVMSTTFSARTLWTLAYLAVIIGVLTQEDIKRSLGLLYFSLLIPMWSGGTYHLFPYECDAMNASIGITVVVWLMWISTTIAAALVGRYLWATYSRSLIAWGSEVLVVKSAPAARPARNDDVVLPDPGA